MTQSSDQHLFAVNVADLEKLKQDQYRISDKLLVHRLATVLRLHQGDSLILFDDTHSSQAHITAADKKTITLELSDAIAHKPLIPEIHWGLPLLKREAFEQALYSLTEMGASSIQPLVTAKVSRSWGSEKDYARARMIQIAAAEQSKQYAIPPLHPVTSLKEWQPGEGKKVFFDGEGAPLKQVLGSLESADQIVCLSGPEGDLTSDEKEYLKKTFEFCSLTPTILRAQQAVAVGLGALRSYLR